MQHCACSKLDAGAPFLCMSKANNCILYLLYGLKLLGWTLNSCAGVDWMTCDQDIECSGRCSAQLRIQVRCKSVIVRRLDPSSKNLLDDRGLIAAHTYISLTHATFSSSPNCTPSCATLFTALKFQKMFRQAVSSSSRALRSGTRVYAPRFAARAQFTPAPLSFAARSQTPSSRWYSDQAEPAAKKEGEDAKDAAKDAEAPASAEAELKKKLEAKEKEVIDWKVRRARALPCSTVLGAIMLTSNASDRTSTFALSPTSETSRIALLATRSPPRTTPSRSSPRTWLTASTTSTAP